MRKKGQENNKAQTKTILKVEDKQRAKWFLLGGFTVAILQFLLVWILK